MNDERRTQSTSTRAFGSGERRSHDASSYYARRINQAQPMARERIHYHENPLPPELTNQALEEPFTTAHDPEHTLPDQSVHLLATAIGPEIPAKGLEAWLNDLQDTWEEALRVLTPGGRICVTVANPGPQPYVPLHALVIGQCQQLGLLMRGEIILKLEQDDQSKRGWPGESEEGSEGHRYILAWSKDGYRRPRTMGRSSTISGPEFIRATRSIWTLPSMIEAHRRAAELYTYGGEVVCDPLTGKGDAAQAALASGRRFVGYGSDPQVQDILDAAAARWA